MMERKPIAQLSVTGFPGPYQAALWFFAPAVLKVAVAVLATALAAQVEIRLSWGPVPMTLQTLAVMLTGLALGWRLAPVAMLAYLGLGAAGVGVFATESAGLAGPTGGYLLGFVPAAALVGYLGREPGWWRTLAAATGGTVLVFACGVPWLGLYLGINLEQAVRLGLLPFVLDAALKIAVAVAAVQAVRHYQNPPTSQIRRGGSSGGPLT
jgi:biotin transport system substrate-specific component